MTDVPSSRSVLHARARLLINAGLYPAIILILNIALVAKLFHVAYSAYLGSNEGTFIAIARQVAAHLGDLRWWPQWYCGMPFQNTYLPLLPLLTAAFSLLTGHSAALAFHQVCAVFFSAGPVCLYFMAWRMTQQPGTSFAAALAYSLLSPCAWLFPMIRADLGSPWHLRRLHILAFYGEGPYTAALAFLPLAILFLYLAITERRLWHQVLAGVFLAATVLANAFGAVLVAIIAVSLLAVIDTRHFWRNAGLLLVIGVLSYAAISPLLPPSVIAAISSNSPSADGDYRFTLRSLAGVAVMAAGFLILWWTTRKAGSPFLRFLLLFAFLTTAIVSLGSAHVYVLPQPQRYQIAMDMALCLLVVFSAEMLLRSAPKLVPWVVMVCLLAALPLLRHDLNYAHRLIQATDITTTAPYRVARWMDENLYGQRVMVGGSYSFYFNDFTDTPQLLGGHYPMLPNAIMRIANFTLYTGTNTARDGQVSVMWLKALGAHAIAVPGPHSSEYYKPFANPRKFEGLLPVLWREGDDTIYALPSRSNSLAHVIAADSVVRHAPHTGLETTEIERYVKAMDDPSLPEAQFVWQDRHTAVIDAQLKPQQVVSVQVTYSPGWRAAVNGAPLSVNKDGLGLIVLEPACQSRCEITLVYDGGLEWRATCLASLAAFAIVLGCFVVDLAHGTKDLLASFRVPGSGR